MTEFDKNAFEQQIRAEVVAEQRAKQRAYKAEWRNKNREHGRNVKLYERSQRKRLECPSRSQHL